MYTLVSFAAALEENRRLKKIFSEVTAYQNEERAVCFLYERIQDFLAFLQTEPLIDFISYDYSSSVGRTCLLQVRRQYQRAQLLIVAAEDISPMEYLRPGISPNGLLLKPYTQEQMKEVWEELVDNWMEKCEERTKESFLIESRGETLSIPYRRIFYFEAREKKVFVRLKSEGYFCYGTLDAIAEILPPFFLRCHRGFLVNMKRVRQFLPAEGTLTFSNKITIPVSRNGKRLVREYYHAGKQTGDIVFE